MNTDIPESILQLPAPFIEMYRVAPPFLTRQELSHISGGAVAWRTIANRDAKNRGPQGAQRLGKHIVYPKEPAVLWLYSLLSPVKPYRGKF